jgi:peptide methionine sulfoxide reductase MsrA
MLGSTQADGKVEDTSQLLPRASRRVPVTTWLVAGLLGAAALYALSPLAPERERSAPPASGDAPPDPPTWGAKIYLGNGCFWERQWAYYNLETSATGPFERPPSAVSSLVGYAGALPRSVPAEVCYHTNDERDYGMLGHAEVVQVALDTDESRAAAQMSALAADFFGSFVGPAGSRGRPDPGDRGSPYRSVVGFPGGMSSPLYARFAKENTFGMSLEAGHGGGALGDGDKLNTVWVLDSDKFPFHVAEVYHQYHCNFFMSEGMPYPDEYTLDLWKHMQAEKKIAPTGCPEDVMPHDSCSGGLFSLFG